MKLLAVTTGVLLIASACGGGDSPVATPTPTASGSAGAFPQDVDWRDCGLYTGAGPPPLPGRTYAPIPGRCATERLELTDGVRVTEVQEWRCEDWSAIVTGYPACSGEFGRYTTVSRERDGQNEVLSTDGQFPPGLAQ